MFPSPKTGEMYHPDSIAKLHEKILRDTGLEHIRFHDLRHTFATMAVAAHVDIKAISASMGHSNAAMTLNIYADATAEGKQRAAQTMQTVLSGGEA